MKKILLIVSLFMLSIGSGMAQDPLKKAIDDFHSTLAFTYHPMADDNNFEPIRTKSHELAQKAEAIEEAFEGMKKKPKEMQAIIEPLAEQCEALDKIMATGAEDEAIRSRLNTIHERFHELESVYFKEYEKK